MTSKKLLIFLALAFILGWGFQGLAITGGLTAGGRSNWLIGAMWSPMLAALLTGSDTRKQVWMRVKRIGWKFWPLALVVGWSFGIVSQLLLAVMQQGHWNADMFRLTGNHGSIDSIHHVAMLLGSGQQGYGFFALNIVLSICLGSLITMVLLAIGEEGGWRGVLQPELERRFGAFKGTLLVGLIWGYWHLPVNLAGFNDAQHPVLQTFIIFPLETVAMAFALAWLVRCTGSIWPGALAHAANNVLQSGPLMVPNNWQMDQLTSILSALAIGSIFAWLLLRLKSTAANRLSSSLADS